MNNTLMYIDPSGEIAITLTAGLFLAGSLLLVGTLMAIDPNVQRAVNQMVTDMGNAVSSATQRVVETLNAKGKADPKDLEKGMSRAQKELYKKEIHDYKRDHGMPPNHNLPWDVLITMAEYARQNAR